MARQYFEDLLVDPPSASLSAITAVTETALWSPALFSPVNAFDPRPGKVYRLSAGGIYSTGASGTLTITPRWGTSTAGISLGASIVQTVPINVAAQPWILDFTLVFRQIGTAASTSTAFGTGRFVGAGTAATASSGTQITFGGTQITTADTTTAQGICIGWTLSVAGSVTPGWVTMQALN